MAPNETNRDQQRQHQSETPEKNRTTAEDANETGQNTGTDQPDADSKSNARSGNQQ